MSIVTVPLLNKPWHIYAVVCESGSDNFVVKIGVSSEPFNRYGQLLTAIPFKSVMLYAPVGARKRAYTLERILHRGFSSRNTKGEWFLFKLDEKQIFHDSFKEIYKRSVGKELAWEKITQDRLKPHVGLSLEPRTNWKTCPSQVTIKRKDYGFKR